MSRALVIFVLLSSGCAGLEYRGWAPSVRTMADQPGMEDYYVGADMRFAVVEPSEQKSTTRPIMTQELREQANPLLIEPPIP